MQSKQQHHGSFFLRLMIFGFSVATGVLAFWLLGYILRDIDRIDGPDYQMMMAQGLPADLQAEQLDLVKTSAEVAQQIKSAQERRRLGGLTTDATQQTINQLLELKRISAEKSQPLDDEQQKALTENLELFLSNQRQTQQLNNELTTLNDQLDAVMEKQRQNSEAISVASIPIQLKYGELVERRQWQLAAYKLGLLIPLLIVCGWLFMRHAGGAYAMLVYAIGGAVAMRVLLVMHDHFPAIYFKYILILLSLAISISVLVRMLRLSARPSRDWLLRQYREAYASFLCPVCEHPIQRGSLKFANWTRRSLRKYSLRHGAIEMVGPEQPYTCPCCATTLYEKCQQCSGVRHSLLPACEKCGHQHSSDALA